MPHGWSGIIIVIIIYFHFITRGSVSPKLLMPCFIFFPYRAKWKCSSLWHYSNCSSVTGWYWPDSSKCWWQRCSDLQTGGSCFASQCASPNKRRRTAKNKLISWLDCLHPHNIFASYDNLSSLNILKYLDHFLLQKMKYFLQGDRLYLEFIFSRKCS